MTHPRAKSQTIIPNNNLTLNFPLPCFNSDIRRYIAPIMVVVEMTVCPIPDTRSYGRPPTRIGAVEDAAADAEEEPVGVGDDTVDNMAPLNQGGGLCG